MNDYIVRATAGNAQIRAFAAVTTNLVEEARGITEQVRLRQRHWEDSLTGGVMMEA